MLDYLITERLYNKIMEDPKYAHKFWSFFWRAAMPYWVLFAAAALAFAVTGMPDQFAVLFVTVLLVIGNAVPIAHWVQHHRNYE